MEKLFSRFLISAIVFSQGTVGYSHHQDVTTADKGFLIKVTHSGKPAEHHLTLTTNEPVALDIAIEKKPNAKGATPKLVALTIIKREGKTSLAESLNLRALTPSTYFADNIIFPTAGNWTFTLELQRPNGTEKVVFDQYVELSADDRKKQEQRNLNRPLPNFTLTDSQEKSFSLENLRGKVWVVSFVFTSCQDICPIMSSKMAALQKEFQDQPQFHLVSITTDPKTDTAKVLAEYAKRFKADTSRWHFLTGDKKAIVALGKEGFNFPLSEASVNHSAEFALVNDQGKLLGLYDSRNVDDLKDLKSAIRALTSAKK